MRNKREQNAKLIGPANGLNVTTKHCSIQRSLEVSFMGIIVLRHESDT